MESILRNVTELESAQRSWLEGALGRQLGDNQQIIIHVVTPGVDPDPATKNQALNELAALAAQAAAHRLAAGISESDAESALDEAIRHVRPRGAP